MVSNDFDYAVQRNPNTRKIIQNNSNNSDYNPIVLDPNANIIIFDKGIDKKNEVVATTDTAALNTRQKEIKENVPNNTGIKRADSASVSLPKQEDKPMEKPPEPDLKKESRFHTAIPGFDRLNTKGNKGYKKPEIITNTGVDIHIKGNAAKAVTVEEQEDGSSIVYFEGSEMYAVIPKGQSKSLKQKPMIVYDPQTNTMAFSNIKEGDGKGFEVKLLPPDNPRYPKDLKNSANILINNCHAKHVDTAELGEYQKGLTQNVVFQNSTVDRFDTLGDNYITMGETTINNSNNHLEKANGKNYTNWASDNWASDGHVKVTRDGSVETSNGNGQSGFTLNEGFRWLGGEPNTAGSTDKKAKVAVGETVLIDVDFKDANLCRQFNGVDIYVQGTDSRNIINSHNGDTWYFDFNGTKISFPEQIEPGKGKIYYDAKSGTLMFEGIDGLEINYTEAEENNDKVALLQNAGNQKVMTSSGTQKVVKMLIKDCRCKNVNCMETEATKDDAKFKLRKIKTQDVIVFENSTADNLYANNDIVVIIDEKNKPKTEINYYAGESTQIVGVGSDKLTDNNHIEEVKNQFKPHSNIDLSAIDGFSDVRFDNVLIKEKKHGIEFFVQGDDSKIKINDYQPKYGEFGATIDVGGMIIVIPPQKIEKGKTPRFHYDAATGAIVLENVKGAQFRPGRDVSDKTKICLLNSSSHNYFLDQLSQKNVNYYVNNQQVVKET